MAVKTLINGKQTDQISSYDRGLQYGDGVFETIAVQNSNLLCFEEHLERLISGCKRLNIPFSDTTLLKEEANSLIESDDSYVIKIIITRGEGGRGYALPNETKPSRIISLHPFPQHPEKNRADGIKARICDYKYTQNESLAGIKHLNRLEQVLARSEWNDESLAEGIILDTEENVIEGTMSNIFCLIDDVLYTPDLGRCGVEGIIRNKIITLASDLKVEIKNITLETLYNAREVFVCNSIIGIWPIQMIDDKTFSVGETTLQIKQTLLDNHCIPLL
jgi:4-amino-4-deoxychorismate lyase